MFTDRRRLHAFFSVIFAVLLLSSAVAAQEKPAGAPSPSDATGLPILNLNPPARPTPEKGTVAQDGLFDFTLPRMKLVGLIPPYNRHESSMAINPEIVEAEEMVVKAKAAHRLTQAVKRYFS